MTDAKPQLTTYPARVLEVWNPSLLTRAVRLTRPPEIVFAASQALRIYFEPELFHPMTIASGPARPYLEFAAQRSDSDFKRAFFALAPGDAVELGPVKGHFLLERERPALMIAAGIGVTPFRSMLQAVVDEGVTLRGVLLHAARGPLDVPFRDEIEELARRAGVRVVRATGPFADGTVGALVRELGAPVAYVAGPVEDVKAGRELLEELGVAKDAIKLEAFRYPGSLATPGPRFPDWQELYRAQSAEKLPWYYADIDPDLARAVEGLSGRALDVGTGPGTQAIALAAHGFEATGTDIAEAAVEGARARAAERGVAARFVVDDILASRLEGRFDVIFDRGCFHVLPPDRRADYLRAVSALLAPAGRLLIKCFADDQPGETGPHRFSPDDIRTIFGAAFEVVEITRTVYQGTLDPLPRALFCVLRARS